MALSQDGSTMCTAEVKLLEEGIGDLVCLKFWASESLNKNFSFPQLFMSLTGFQFIIIRMNVLIMFYRDASISL